MPLTEYDQPSTSSPSSACPLEAEGERVTLSLEGVDMFVEDERVATQGSLHLTTEKVLFLSKNASEKSYKLDYPSVLLHAICKDASVCDKPCLYCQVSANPKEIEEEEPAEVKFSPGSEEELQNLFSIFSEMQMLWPDEQSDDEENDHGLAAICEGDEEDPQPGMMLGDGFDMEALNAQMMAGLGMGGEEEEELDSTTCSFADTAGAGGEFPSPGSTDNGWTLGKDKDAMEDAEE